VGGPHRGLRPDHCRGSHGRFEDLGLDELTLDPTIAELDQIDRLADALL
jgi:hypothetical protein